MKDAVTAIQENNDLTAFILNFTKVDGVMYGTTCVLHIDDGKPWVDVREFSAYVTPLNFVEEKKIVNKRELKALFGFRPFLVMDGENMGTHEMFFKGLGLPLNQENMDELVERYNDSPFFYVYKFKLEKKHSFNALKQRLKRKKKRKGGK